MVADWTETTPEVWKNPHERSFYRESIQPQQPPSTQSFQPLIDPNSNVGYPNSFTGLSKELEEKQRRLQDSLNKVLGPEYVQNRPGGGGTKLTYLEGWRAINLANEVFGYNGWFTDIKYLEIDFCDFNPESQRWSMGVTAIVRVRLPDGASHEDIGYGKLENTKSKGDGLDKCKKEAVTDGLKRALRHFGKLLGNCLYDKHYLTQLSAMKAPKPKFNFDDLYKPENHSLHAPCPKPIPPRGQVPAGAIDPSTLPPPPLHPPHMQRAQTVGSKPTNQQQQQQQQQSRNNQQMKSSVLPQQTSTTTNSKPTLAPPSAPPQRSATISHSSSSRPVAAPLPQPNGRTTTSNSVTTESGLGSDFDLEDGDDSFLVAAMDIAEENASTAAAATVRGGDGQGHSSGTLGSNGREVGGDDSGFVEASFIAGGAQETTKGKDHRSRPLPPNNAAQPRPRTSTTPASTTSTTNSDSNQALLAERRAAALAIREKKEAERAVAALKPQQQTSTGIDVVSTTTNNTAQQSIKKASALRPPVPPVSRSNSINKSSTSVPSPVAAPRQAGSLPTLNVGNGIVQAQQQQQQLQQQATIPAAGGDVGISHLSQGFMSAKGVKRKSEEPVGGGGVGPYRSHTISTSNPSSGNRQILGEIEVDDSGQTKRFRAFS